MRVLSWLLLGVNLGCVRALSVRREGDLVEKRAETITFNNPAAKQFYVDGAKLPLVPFDAGPSYAGLLPISSDPNETRKLFFWFWPTNNPANVKNLMFWTNGGPGCSAFQGLLEENGPISWNWGQAGPTPNPWTWTNLSNMLWVEQPVGTGFSQGTPNITNEDQLADQLIGFMQQFLNVFDELKGNDFWVTGESYGGFYVPYIASHIYADPSALDLKLKGIFISDPSITYPIVQKEIPALRFVQANKNLMPLNSTYMRSLQKISDTCGFTNYLDKYLKYPPKGPIPLPKGSFTKTYRAHKKCALNQRIMDATTLINPAFDQYRVTDMWPIDWSVLGFPRAIEKFVYFNRTDVQDAIHAPHVKWEACATPPVFNETANHNSSFGINGGKDGDSSVPSALSVLPGVIEKSERVVIVHGLEDFSFMPEGTRIAIQNMTWEGKQGFQTPIKPESFTRKNMGVLGNAHTERKLTYVEFYFSGHMTPQFVPWAAYQTVEYLLGMRDSPSS
ncbi:hypothetical protein JAAARDRAFT_37728 [Jaapia argillacea MUCL 33604]|uniref:Carboxypeptidase n=1 Tax=Jaapia argillacea MUCL 33604 TaxID=933084 RepID=A0A067PV89_9AGAM|nr:hypothetical protein JAAARDRAFT_37728 [Jaapia argillacea MUCL 33604]